MSTPCPHCAKPLQLNGPPEHNVLTYGNPAVAVALCCGKGVKLYRVQRVDVLPYNGPNTEDDWGHRIKH